jgi:hypothetical protein
MEGSEMNADYLSELYDYYPYIPEEGDEPEPPAVEPRNEQQSRARFELVERVRVAFVSDKMEVLSPDDRNEINILSRQLFSFEDFPKRLQWKVMRVEGQLRRRLAREGVSMQQYLYEIQP